MTRVHGRRTWKEKLTMKCREQLEEGMGDIRGKIENIKNPFWDHRRKPTLYIYKMFYGKKQEAAIRKLHRRECFMNLSNHCKCYCYCLSVTWKLVDYSYWHLRSHPLFDLLNYCFGFYGRLLTPQENVCSAWQIGTCATAYSCLPNELLVFQQFLSAKNYSCSFK